MAERLQVNVAGRLAMIERYEQLITDSKGHLESTPRCWVTTLSGEVEVTEHERNRVRGHIDVYRQCIERLNTW
ncbi:MAG: hypothetical protein JWL65_5387 [Gammaproteobacteria bacterium]|nr:hypothetical protein [Gammaproteobacteria bacterium]